MTKEKWSALSGKGQWDVIVALRGPDIAHSDTMKWFTTSVIRGAMHGVIRVGGMVNTDFQVVVLPNGTLPGLKAAQKTGVLPIYVPSLTHFLQHVAEAANWLGVPILHLDPKVWEEAMCAPAQTAGRMIVDQFPPLTDGSGVSLRPEVKAIVEWLDEGKPLPTDGPFGYPPPLKATKSKFAKEVSSAANGL